MISRIAKIWPTLIAALTIFVAPVAMAQFPSPTYLNLMVLGTQTNFGPVSWNGLGTFGAGINVTGSPWYEIGGVPIIVQKNGGQGITLTQTFDQSTVSPITRQSTNVITLTPSVDTTSIFEPNVISITVAGPGQSLGEINGFHAFIATAPGGHIHTSENFESSTDNQGITDTQVAFLHIQHNESAGTLAVGYGLKSQLTNDNTTPNSVGIWAGIDCEAKAGAGSAPQFNYCLLNRDSGQAIATAGGISLGTIAPPPTGTLLNIQGSDNSSGTFPVVIKNLAGTNILLVRNSGEVDLSGPFNLGGLQGVRQPLCQDDLKNIVSCGANSLPTVSAGFGSSPTVIGSAGPYSFSVSIGGTPGNTGTIQFAFGAPHYWSCLANNLTAASAARTAAMLIFETSHADTTHATFTTFSVAGVAGPPTASDEVDFTCSAI